MVKLKLISILLTALSVMNLSSVKTGGELPSALPPVSSIQPMVQVEVENISQALQELPQEVLNEIEEQESKARACAAGTFKSYTDYRVYQNKSTPQYDLQVHPDTYTDEDGFRRHGKYYIVAVGSYYGREIWSTYHVVMKSGREFDIIIGDQKQNRHTDELNCYCLNNGSVLEFIVDTNKLGNKSKTMGDVSYSAGLEGDIAYIY